VPQDRHRNDGSSFQIGVSRALRMAHNGMLAVCLASATFDLQPAVGSWLDESLLQAIEHIFQMRVPRHAFKGDFVVPRPLLLARCLILIGFVHPHVMQERD
jgi:hypothetical protein